MLDINTALLSRIQFAFTISFHILFPAFSIGLAFFLAIAEGIWLKTKLPIYRDICKFWTKIFALTFGMGVVSGIVMEFQLGTNWAGFTQEVGGILGVLFTYEVMTAFFIEAGFLGVMLFGWNRVSPKLHYLATLLVTIGTTFSAYWILCANTWMQHPVGYKLVNHIFDPASWRQVLLNPDLFPRFFHMLLACYISASLVILSVSAFYLLKQQHVNFAKKCFSIVSIGLLILIPLQIFMGDETGFAVHQYQPIKTAAIEGVWNTQRGAELILFAIPDQKAQKNLAVIGIPHLSSVLNTHQWNGLMVGLKSVPKADQPSVSIVFYTFRIMVGIAFLMLLIVFIGIYLKLRNRFYDTPWFLKLCVISSPLGFIALWCGWVTAEVGRQPWIVYGLLRTADAVSKVSIHDVIISFALIIIVYGVIFGCFYTYYLNKIIQKGPEESDTLESKMPFTYMPSGVTSQKEDNK